MRIAYLAHVRSGSRSGVFHKLAGQVSQWRRNGHEARVFLATGSDVGPWRERLADAHVLRYDGPVARELIMMQLVRAIRRFDPELLYLRFSLFHPPMLAFPSRARIVVEINTDDTYEYALKGRLRAMYNARTRDLIFRRADAMVFVTSELSRREAFRSLTAARAVIANGIDLDEYPELPPPQNEPRLVFVGGGQSWHGVDKLLALAELRPRWQFDFVGEWNETDVMPPNVHWYGELDREDLLDVLARAHIGVGTLALHRNSLDEACTLKVREYLAVGLPVMYGYHDPDADDLGRFVLRLPNTESNVIDSLPGIDSFVNESLALRVPRSSIRHIDVTNKERQRLELFESVMRQ